MGVKLDPAKKAAIIELSRAGVPNSAIAKKLDLNGQRVNGAVQSARNKGTLPPAHAKGTPSDLLGGGVPISDAPPVAQQTAAPDVVPPQPTPADDLLGGRPVLGALAGPGSGAIVRFTIDRIQPPDGLLGSVDAPSLSREEIGQQYGSGLYRVVRYETGKTPMEYPQIRISDSFGPPKTPGAGAAAARAPYGQNGDRTIVSQDPSGKMVDVMRDMFQSSLKQLEEARKSGPDNVVAQILKDQQALAQTRWDQERVRDEDRRKEERERWERDRNWALEQRAAEDLREQKRHDRELERIRAETEARLAAAAKEQKFMLEIEEKKIAIMRLESETAEKRLQKEITRSTEALKESQEKTEKQLSENRKELQKIADDIKAREEEKYKRDKEYLDKLHETREKSLDREHALNEKILDIKLESKGDDIVGAIRDCVKEGGKALKEISETQRIRSMGQDAQVAYVAKGASDGNVTGQDSPPPPAAAAAAAAAQPTPAARPSSSRVEQMIREHLASPAGQELIAEWVANVESGQDATAFASLYLEFMRDPDDSRRQAAVALAAWMKIRDWSKVYAAIRSELDPDAVRVLDGPRAAGFYEQLRALVALQIADFWENCVRERAERAEHADNGNGKPPPAAAPEHAGNGNGKPSAAAAAPEPEPQKPVFQVVPPSAPAVPTRESLQETIRESKREEALAEPKPA